MMESIGLSGMTETPLVIVNTQRGGPSTGLPTKQEQSDLMQMIYGTHGDIPKIVIAPTSASDAFYLTIEAFNLAEEYQCPVILLSDLQLSLGKQTVESLDYDKIEIRRGALIEEDMETPEDKAYFKRYALTDSGISPRVLPGTKVVFTMLQVLNITKKENLLKVLKTDNYKWINVCVKQLNY